MKIKLRIKLPKSARNLIIGTDRIDEDFGLSASNGRQEWLKIKPEIKQSYAIKIIKGNKE